MKKIIAICILCTLFFSCTKNNSSPDKSEMVFAPRYYSDSPGLGFASKATDTDFESGDIIGLFVTRYDGDVALPLQISGNYANNAAVTYDGSKWTAQPPVYWSEGTFDVYGYYPFINLTSVEEYPFSVSLDQSTAATDETLSGYEASDLLWASTQGVSETDDPVSLVFKHIMSRLVINLIKGEEYTGEIPSDAVVCVHNTVPACYFDVSTGIVTRNPYEVAKTITARQLSVGVYAAILVPQRVSTRLPFVEILSSGVSYLIESTFTLKPGTQHTINIVLNNNPDQVKITVGGEIKNW